MQRVFTGLTLIALFSLTIMVTPAAAQAGTHTITDPSGRMLIPIPPGWTDQSAKTYVHLTFPKPAADLYMIVVDQKDLNAALDDAFKQIGGDLAALVGTKPVQSVPAKTRGVDWTQIVYFSGTDNIVAALGIVKKDVSYFLILRAGKTDAAAINPYFVIAIYGAVFMVEITPPPYADQTTFSETDVKVTTGKWTMPGVLTMPKGDGPFPALVLVHGSGANNRDESVGPNLIFRDLAWGLASKGIAVLRYEDRAYTYGIKVLEDITTFTVKDEKIDDALSAVAQLRATKGIDPKRVYVLGHSLGGYLIPRIGTTDPTLPGLIVMAGNNQWLPDLMLEQSKYLGSPAASLEALKKVVDEIAALKPEDKSRKDNILGAGAAYWLDLRAYNPTETAAKLTQPMLFLQGERDYQVSPTIDFKNWQDALKDRKNVTFKLYPGLNHLFLMGTGAATPDEYYVPSHVPAQVITDIAAWITAN